MRRVWVNLNRKSWFGLKAGTGDHEAIRRFRLRWTAFSEEVVALSQRVDDNAFHLPAVDHLFSWRAVISAEPMVAGLWTLIAIATSLRNLSIW